MSERRNLTELVGVRLTAEEVAFLDRMVSDGGHASRSGLIRSILCEIFEDEFPQHVASEHEQVMGMGMRQ